jgi:EmrB/QacA subfamily drug resistance transporter
MTGPATGPPGTTPVAAATTPRRWAALAVLALVQFTIVIDATVVNVALPTVGAEFGLTADGLAWVLNGYLVTAGGLLLLGGRLADVLGRRRMFLAGAAVFAVASAACAVAPSGEVLIAARFLQGAGEALASPAALSIIALLFPDARDRGTALGMWGALAGLGSVVGVLLSGVLTDLAGWRWLFVINLPPAAVALLLVPRLVARDRPVARARRALDLPGAVLVTVGATAVVGGFVSAAEHGWSSLRVLGPLVLGAAALAAFVAVEARSADPLVPLRFFRDRTRVSANVASVFLIGVMAAMFLLLTLYMQLVLGWSALQTGLAYLPFCVVFVAGIGAAVPLMARFGTRATLWLAYGISAAGTLLLTRLPVDGEYATALLPALLVLAVGLGMAFPGLQTAALQGVTEADAGLGSGVQTAVQALANALGIAVFLAVALHTGGGVGGTPDALTAGFRAAFGVATVGLLVGAVLVTLIRDPVRAEAAAAPGGRP